MHTFTVQHKKRSLDLWRRGRCVEIINTMVLEHVQEHCVAYLVFILQKIVCVTSFQICLQGTQVGRGGSWS
jgi:hypothetical protein